MRLNLVLVANSNSNHLMRANDRPATIQMVIKHSTRKMKNTTEMLALIHSLGPQVKEPIITVDVQETSKTIQLDCQ